MAMIMLIPISTSYAQTTDTPSTLGIELTNFTPHFYKSDDGHTIVIGEIQNKNNFPVTNVRIWTGFYDNVNQQPLESTIGTTLLEIIPANGKSPYVIESSSPNDAIENVSVNLQGFNSAPEKNKLLDLEIDEPEITDHVSFSGMIHNNAGIVAKNTRAHVIFYDVFIPPRVIGVHSIELGDVPAESSKEFKFDEERLQGADNFRVIAESDDFVANNIENTKIIVENIKTTAEKISIQNVMVTDYKGEKLSTYAPNSSVVFTSTIINKNILKHTTGEIPYIHYVQILRSEIIDGEKRTFVEFIGTSESTLREPFGAQEIIIDWRPQKEGLYYAETYVWSPEGIALSSPGPLILILVTK
jgi:hypothetical protein